MNEKNGAAKLILMVIIVVLCLVAWRRLSKDISTEEGNQEIAQNVESLPETIMQPENTISYKEVTDEAFKEAAEYLSGDFMYDGRWQKILCIGDSLTEGVQSQAQAPWENPWPTVMRIFLTTQDGWYAEVENAGIGGSTIWSGGAYPMCERIQSCSDADAVFVMGGENDWMYGVDCPLGSLEEPGTFMYDTNRMFQYIKERYADADVFIILPLDTNRQPEEAGASLDEFRNVEKVLAEFYGFYVIDLPGRGILSAADPETREAYFSDDIHPNTYGYQILGTLITAQALQMSEAK